MKKTATAEALRAMDITEAQHEAYKQHHENQLKKHNEPYDGAQTGQ